MEWKACYIVYRITQNADLLEVFHCDDIKKAKYWLQYIAQPGDVLTKTPIHPKHSKSSKCPEYWSHKEKNGLPISQEAKWQAYIKKINFNGNFPEEQQADTANGA
jgi:hypothetical protein